MSSDLGIWIGAIATIAMYSYLWRDNKFFKFGEHVFVALGAAHTMVMGYNNVVEMAWRPMTTKGQLYLIVPILLGLLLYARYSKQWAPWSRLPIAVMVGAGAALTIRGELSASVVKQIQNTMLSLDTLDNILLVVGVVCTISYFFFITKVRVKFIEQTAMIGRWTMMIAFGAAFGNTIMARVSLVIGRLEFLFGRWIPIIKL